MDIVLKIQSNNEWDKLNAVIVGNGFQETSPILETSFKLFYGLDKNDSVADTLKQQVKKQYIEEHSEDIENFVSLLKSHNIKVYRPECVGDLKAIRTPYFNTTTHLTGPLNTRDLSIILGDTILETSPEIRQRYFETLALRKIFKKGFDNGAQWLKMPVASMSEELFTDVDIEPEMMLDAARMMRFNEDIVININTIHNMLALKWLKRIFPYYTFHPVTWCDGHIDSSIAPIKEGLILVNKVNIPHDEMLPKFLQSWDKIYVEYHEDYNADVYAGNDVLLASTNIDCNILSIDPNTIICHDYARKYLQNEFSKYNIECVPAQLRHSRLFDGSFHCLTLDLNRTN